MVYLTNPIFRKASKSDTDQLVDVIYAGFSHHFKHLRTTESKVKAILKEILKIEDFVVIELDRVIVGCLGISKGNQRLVTLQSDVYKNELGLIKGFIANKMLNTIIGKPMNLKDKEGYIEFVTVLDDYRRQGLTTQLIEWVIHSGEYTRLILDVTDDNQKAINLYQKIGFVEFDRKKEFFSKQAGFEYQIYMEYIIKS